MSPPHIDRLPEAASDLARRALDWTDRHWDEEVSLLRSPADALYEAEQTAPEVHLVRETVWYALGLLLRDGAGDRERATGAITAVLRYQFDEPDTPYHGTWLRAPEEPHPPANPVIWYDYDPNWREFIGTALAVALVEYAPRLPAELVAAIDTALRRAIDGTIARDVPAAYTNIALMTAFLLQFGADRFNVLEWAERSERLAQAILDRFCSNGAFDEYNSPTYYGIDLYALALWRAYGGSMLLREGGAAMEAALWHDIARYYHADLRNIAGPYDRSYGMHMRRYVSCLGMWIYLATGPERAPFPDTTQPFEHAWDFALAPLIALLGLQMPDDALPHFLVFQSERQVEQVIANEPRRVATAFIGKWVMLGGEDSGGTHRFNSQYHPATLHWRIDDETIGWLKLLPTTSADGRAEGTTLFITCTNHSGGDIKLAFQIAAPDLGNATFHHDRWDLPGLNLLVETAATGPEITHQGATTTVTYLAREIAPGAPVTLTLRLVDA